MRFARANSNHASGNNFIRPVPGLQAADVILVADDPPHERVFGRFVDEIKNIVIRFGRAWKDIERRA